MQGKVKMFNKEKGYGFITLEDGRDVFFHYSQLQMDGFKTVESGELVDFEVTDSERGLQAVEITVVK